MVKSKCQGHSTVLPSQQVAGQERALGSSVVGSDRGDPGYYCLLCRQ